MGRVVIVTTKPVEEYLLLPLHACIIIKTPDEFKLLYANDQPLSNNQLPYKMADNLIKCFLIGTQTDGSNDQEIIDLHSGKFIFFFLFLFIFVHFLYIYY